MAIASRFDAAWTRTTRVTVAIDDAELPSLESLDGEHSVAFEATVPGFAETNGGQ